jgi:hypothetical protein
MLPRVPSVGVGVAAPLTQKKPSEQLPVGAVRPAAAQ